MTVAATAMAVVMVVMMSVVFVHLLYSSVHVFKIGRAHV